MAQTNFSKPLGDDLSSVNSGYTKTAAPYMYSMHVGELSSSNNGICISFSPNKQVHMVCVLGDDSDSSHLFYVTINVSNNESTVAINSNSSPSDLTVTTSVNNLLGGNGYWNVFIELTDSTKHGDVYLIPMYFDNTTSHVYSYAYSTI